MKKIMTPRLMLIAAMAIFGTLGIFVRNIAVSSGELALYRAIMATIMIGAFLLITRQKIPFANIKKEIPLLLVKLLIQYKNGTVSYNYFYAPLCGLGILFNIKNKKVLPFVTTWMKIVGIMLSEVNQTKTNII